ncbi:FAD-binding oxidoreductase [Clostridium sp.]|uniref:FAD-binding oxidoreductase n=1 Tax=Clostridium sp. TaxID=1506 RepID=UPI003F3344C7
MHNNYKLDITDILNKYSGANSTNDSAIAWKGFRDLVLVDKVQECEDIISFYFKSKDGKKLVKHLAGQFLPFKIKTDNAEYKDALRTYSLSIVPNEHIYRISVKRVPGGLISNYLHDNLNIGDEIEALIPTGLFTLNKSNTEKPLVLIAGGIGITPLLSMLYDSSDKFREVYFIQATQNSNLHPFKSDIESISEKENVKKIVFYDRPLEEDTINNKYDFTGYITQDWIKENLPLNSEFYFCGPPPFMKGINKSLKSLGVSSENIHFEFFGDPQTLD